MTRAPFYLEALNTIPGISAHFVERVLGIKVDTDREATCARLEPVHREVVQGMGFSWADVYRGEQIHSADIAVIKKGDACRVLPGVDGLMTDNVGILLGIYVADCGAVYVVDRVRGAIALLHSGKKGTEQHITAKAIRLMKRHYGSQPEDLYVALAPCIRPPAYEVDFAAKIRDQVLEEGVPESQFVDSGICTSSDLERYYSYRIEKGNTGRMLALLGRQAC